MFESGFASNQNTAGFCSKDERQQFVEQTELGPCLMLLLNHLRFMDAHGCQQLHHHFHSQLCAVPVEESQHKTNEGQSHRTGMSEDTHSRHGLNVTLQLQHTMTLKLSHEEGPKQAQYPRIRFFQIL